MRDVKITAVLNGWIAKVGCQTLVYINKEDLIWDLGEYMDNPKAKEKEILETAVNKYLVANVPMYEPRPAPDGPPTPSYPHAGCAAVEANQRASRSTR